jgi:hypothetical protein
MSNKITTSSSCGSHPSLIKEENWFIVLMFDHWKKFPSFFIRRGGSIEDGDGVV